MTTSLTLPPIGAVLSYVVFNTDVTISATTEGTANTVVTAGAITANGVDSFFVEFYCPGVAPGTTAAAQVILVLYLDGNPISAGASMIGQFVNSAANSWIVPAYVRPIVTPAAGSRTYSIRAYRAGSNGTVRGTAAGTSQAGYVRIVRAA